MSPNCRILSLVLLVQIILISPYLSHLLSIPVLMLVSLRLSLHTSTIRVTSVSLESSVRMPLEVQSSAVCCILKTRLAGTLVISLD